MDSRATAVAFAYHNMGVIGLDALLRHGFRVPAVFSHKDDPNENRWFASVADWCRQRRVPCHTPANVNEAPWPERVREMHPDFIFSFYYRRLLCQAILDVPGRGALNLHGSLLPRYRGCAPVNWALINGETRTGVTLHYMIRRPDAGDIVAQVPVPITEQDTALSLYGKIEQAARRLLDDTLRLLLDGTAPRTPQDDALASTYGRRRPEDGRIDWSIDARGIYNLIRAVTDPYPGAFAYLNGERLTIWRAEVVPKADVETGEIKIRGNDVLVGAASGALRLISVEWRGKRLEGEAVCRALGGYAGSHRIRSSPGTGTPGGTRAL